jgi:hypothetical protein
MTSEPATSNAGRRFAFAPAWVLVVALVPGLAHVVADVLLAPKAPGPASASAQEFMGFRYLVNDHTQYMGFARVAADAIERGRSWGVFLENPFVTDPQDGRHLLLYISSVAWLSRTTGLDVYDAWRALGVVVSWIFFVTCWRFIVRTVSANENVHAVRRDAFLLIAFGNGVSFAVAAALAWRGTPHEQVPEVVQAFFNFSSFDASALPMWLAAYASALNALLLLDPSRTTGKPAARVIGGAALLVLAFAIHPYSGLLGFATLGVSVIAPFVVSWWRSQGRSSPLNSIAPLRVGDVVAVLGVTLAGLVVASYLAWANRDEIFAVGAAKAAGWHDHYDLFWYPIVYGAPLLLAVLGVRALVRERSGACSALCVSLLIASVALSTTPVLPAVKLQYTVQCPLAILAAFGLAHVRELRRAGASRWAKSAITVPLVWLVCTAGSVVNLGRDVYAYDDPNLRMRPGGERALFDALDELPDGNVMSSEYVGALVPWKSGKHVFIGHYFISLDVRRRRDILARFATMPAEERRAHLEHHRIRYVVEDARWNLQGRLAELGLTDAHVVYRKNDVGVIWDLQPAAATSSGM